MASPDLSGGASLIGATTQTSTSAPVDTGPTYSVKGHTQRGRAVKTDQHIKEAGFDGIIKGKGDANSPRQVGGNHTVYIHGSPDHSSSSSSKTADRTNAKAPPVIRQRTSPRIRPQNRKSSTALSQEKNISSKGEKLPKSPSFLGDPALEASADSRRTALQAKIQGSSSLLIEDGGAAAKDPAPKVDKCKSFMEGATGTANSTPLGASHHSVKTNSYQNISSKASRFFQSVEKSLSRSHSKFKSFRKKQVGDTNSSKLAFTSTLSKSEALLLAASALSDVSANNIDSITSEKLKAFRNKMSQSTRKLEGAKLRLQKISEKFDSPPTSPVVELTGGKPEVWTNEGGKREYYGREKVKCETEIAKMQGDLIDLRSEILKEAGKSMSQLFQDNEIRSLILISNELVEISTKDVDGYIELSKLTLLKEGSLDDQVSKLKVLTGQLKIIRENPNTWGTRSAPSSFDTEVEIELLCNRILDSDPSLDVIVQIKKSVSISKDQMGRALKIKSQLQKETDSIVNDWAQGKDYSVYPRKPNSSQNGIKESSKIADLSYGEYQNVRKLIKLEAGPLLRGLDDSDKLSKSKELSRDEAYRNADLQQQKEQLKAEKAGLLDKLSGMNKMKAKFAIMKFKNHVDEYMKNFSDDLYLSNEVQVSQLKLSFQIKILQKILPSSVKQLTGDKRIFNKNQLSAVIFNTRDREKEGWERDISDLNEKMGR